MAWAQAHRSGATAERVRRLAARLIRTEGVETVGEPPSPGRPARYSTTELVDIERAALALVERGREAGAPSITDGAARRDRACRQDRPLGRAGGDGPRGRDESRAGSSASSASPAPARRPRPTPSGRSSRRRASRCSAPRRRALRRRSSRTRPESRRRRSTGSSTTRAPAGASRPAPYSSSTRPAWPRRASSRPCSTWSSRPTARRS